MGGGKNAEKRKKVHSVVTRYSTGKGKVGKEYEKDRENR